MYLYSIYFGPKQFFFNLNLFMFFEQRGLDVSFIYITIEINQHVYVQKVLISCIFKHSTI